MDFITGHLAKSRINEGMVPHFLHIMWFGYGVIPRSFGGVKPKLLKDSSDLVLGHVVVQRYFWRNGGKRADQVGP